MEEQFEYGELVEVRDNDDKEWNTLDYICTANNGERLYITTALPNMSKQLVARYSVRVYAWKQIRKIQKPEPALIDIEQTETIEQRMDKFEAVFNGAVKHINKQLESIKNQLK